MSNDLSYKFFSEHFSDVGEYEWYIEWAERYGYEPHNEQTWTDFQWYCEEMQVAHEISMREPW